MISLSKEQVVSLHAKMVAQKGGVSGVASEAMLDSALLSALQTHNGKDLYPTTIDKIARITYGIIKNHPFVDGNKRIATFVMLILLRLNHINTSISNDDVVYIGRSIANGTMSYQELVVFISQRR